ncbi:glycerol kinase GlpK [Corynebacterium epidermidicanis]|uniref:Glycerol kinase n=1 Tax=Corynebacterium epidermidicanis TaxID=1050174 RepID=A0A0G3GU98_9CORY|nr:glycerol kinase GlpK [Corynebacterium epidermidicanis]AKK02452.1 glycerol kinase [Corynebacterium epidermidicanis]
MAPRFPTRIPHRRSIVAAIDQGTTSTRCMLFDDHGQAIASSHLEHRQIFPRPGWVEHDPMEIWANTRRVMADVLARAEVTGDDIAAVGITNQRETTVVWDKTTGQPVYNAIVWQDTRTSEICADLQAADFEHTGLPVSTYFSGPKIRWILDNVPGARERAETGELIFGTVESWLIWNLTRGEHVTDVTNASRTMLMDLSTGKWDHELAEKLQIPVKMLPKIVSNSQVIGKIKRVNGFNNVPIAGVLGDQQAAAFGQACLEPGEVKNTYGTGNFLLLNTGNEIKRSEHGLISTVAYKLGNEPTTYALEGSIAVTGSLVQWLRDNLGIISTAPDVEKLAESVPDNGGCYIVPAFSGLLAPYWREDARGVICGLTRFHTKAHFARAALEATAYQTREVVEAMNQDTGIPITALKADGGMVGNSLLMQFQADQLGVPVMVPKITETTALGAAYAAGLAVGVYKSMKDIRAMWREQRTYHPHPTEDALFDGWRKAVEKSFDS